MTSGTLTERSGAADESDDDTVTTPEPSPETTAAEDDETELSTDTLFELLKNRRRRDAIDYLTANDGRATLSDMAERIAGWENDLPVEHINSKQRKRVYISLYQCHLPKMDRAGIIDFDKNRGTIELNRGASQLYPYLKATEGDGGTDATETVDGDTEPRESAGVTVQSSALAGTGVAGLAGVAGVPGFDLLSPVMWAVVCASCLLVVAVLPMLRD